MINAAQTLIKKKFHYSGIEDFECFRKTMDQEMVQTIHTGSNHWSCISPLFYEEAIINIYDS